MSPQLAMPASRQVRAGSCPGGVGRQFRLQRWDVLQGTWVCHATFVQRDEAQRCLERMTNAGQQARLVGYSCAPSAA